MKRFFFAVGLGALSEGLFAIIGLARGWEPCGPGSIGGMFWFFIHAPALALMEALRVKEPKSLYVIFTLYSLIWASLWHLGLRKRFVRGKTGN